MIQTGALNSPLPPAASSSFCRAVRAIFELAENPFLAGSIALRGYTNLYRVRFWHGRFRMVYHVSEKQRKVVVTRVRPRGTAYIGMRGEG